MIKIIQYLVKEKVQKKIQMKMKLLMQKLFLLKKNKLGRKRKGENYDNNNEEHDKFSNDNITRKVKHIIFAHLLKYLNKQIKIKYNGKIGKGVFKKNYIF